MNANPILLQKKYSRVIECFAQEIGITLDKAIDFFFQFTATLITSTNIGFDLPQSQSTSQL